MPAEVAHLHQRREQRGIDMATKEQLRKMREKYHLGEYSNKAKKHKATRKRTRSPRRHASKGGSMTKRGRRRGRRSGGLLSGKGMLGGKLGLGGGIMGLVGTAAIGYFLAPMVANMVPVNIPFKAPITGFVLAGPAGAAGAYLASMNNTGTTASSGTW